MQPSARAMATMQLKAQIKTLFHVGRGNYGSRRIKRLLAQEGLRVSRRRIGRLMRQNKAFLSYRGVL